MTTWNVTDMFGNPMAPEQSDEDQLDTYQISYRNEADGVTTENLQAFPVLTASYCALSHDPNSVDLLIPFDRLISLRKVEAAGGES